MLVPKTTTLGELEITLQPSDIQRVRVDISSIGLASIHAWECLKPAGLDAG